MKEDIFWNLLAFLLTPIIAVLICVALLIKFVWVIIMWCDEEIGGED